MLSTSRTGADVPRALEAVVDKYRHTGDMAELQAALAHLRESAMADALIVAAEPYREMPEVAGPLYEKVVDEQPGNARALVILANAYWLSGRGPEVVGDLATRAIAADPANRGAWHLWSLSESNPRDRVARWRQTTERFPDDDLARANFADNLSSLAGAEFDPNALVEAIAQYELLLSRAGHPDQKLALESAINTLRGWRL